MPRTFCIRAFAAIACYLVGPLAVADDLRHGLINGPSGYRVDIAVLGDGFTIAERDSFFSAAQGLVEDLLGQAPFSSYRDHFNARFIFTPSNESGADDPSEGIFRDTAFGAAFDCFDIPRLLCMDNGAVASELARRLDPDQHDITLVIVNDSQYGGSGGIYPATSLNASASEIAVHEIGHSFGRLADEYEADQATCDFYQAWIGAPNIEDTTFRALIKWNKNGGPPTGWISTTRAIPSTDQTPSLPGLYEGGGLCPRDSGLYRPTFNSKMRSLGQPFDQINSEQLVLQIYAKSGIIAGAGSDGESVRALDGQSLPFSVDVIGNPALLSFSWYRLGEDVSANASLFEGDVQAGINQFDYRVEDVSGFVRNGEGGSSRAQRRLFLAYGDSTEREPNGSETNASLLEAGKTVSGILRAEASDDTDVYLLEAPDTGQIELKAAARGPSAAEARLRISSLDGLWVEDFEIRSAALEVVIEGPMAGGSYTVEMASTQPLAYALNVDYTGATTQAGPPRVEVVAVQPGEVRLRVRPALGDSFPVSLYSAECSDGEMIQRVESSGPDLVVSGLMENGAYECSVRAINAFGAGTASAISRALAPDSATPGLPIWLLGEILKNET